MSKDQKKSKQRWVGGIGDSLKEGANQQIPDQFYFSRSLDYRTDPQSITLLPGAVKESGSVVTDLLKFADIVPTTLTSYFYGNSGNVYSRSSAASWTKLFTVSGSHGNGLSYFSGDDYLYLTGDSNISRYGPIQNSPQFTANFLTAQGGVPQNTASLLLASASTMYAWAADSATLSITGNLTLETYFKANTLPTTGNSMTLLGKWDESGATRSYKLDLYGVSGYFGDGSDGALTISADATEAPIDSACTGTSGTQTLSATNASFAQGQVILIHQSQGTNAGQWERNTIQGYTAGTITLGTALIGTYVSGAQVRVEKQYTNVTINSGKTYTAKAWNGTVGGILAYLANGTVTTTGTITANGGAGGSNSGTPAGGTGGGFRGGAGANANPSQATQGEGTTGAGGASTSANGNGGGGSGGAGASHGGGGGGGGNATAGGDGTTGDSRIGGTAGIASGSTGLTTATFGGGGGGGANDGGADNIGGGGSGGGFIFITGVTLTVDNSTGAITANGGNGGGCAADGGSGGGGAGGSILLKVQTATLNTTRVTASKGNAGTGNVSGGAGGDGSVGRIHIDYLTSYTGTTSPTIDATQDNTLVTTTTIQARLGISNDGTAFEYLTQNLTGLTTGTWNRLSVAWTAASAMATFYLGAVALGTSTGTKTSISDNASLLYVGNNKTSVLANYFDGYLNDMRIWNNVQTAGQIFANNNIQVPVASSGLQAYYKFNSAYTDATANANNLTAVNTPTFSADVPFAAPTTRLDIDTQSTSVGQTYTLLTTISETSTNKLSFTPVNDPQASVGFYVDTKGTGTWTLTIHDTQNRTIATSSIATASIPASGFVEFAFTTPWRLVRSQSYHMHLTVSTGTSKVVTNVASDFSTAEYASYFGFLVTDTMFHPITQFQYEPLGGTLTGAEIIGNERYLAVWDGVNYYPNFLTLTPGWKVRCFAQWRQYLAIGVWKGSNIYDYHQGRIYFWTGYQPAYDFFIDVPEGQINALFGVDSDLYMFAGHTGNLLDYKGGYFQNTGNSASNKLKKMPLLATSDTTEVYPGALNMWRGMLHFGLYANSTSTTAQRGVYSFGTLNQFYPDSLSYDYPISTGNRGSTVSIGLVYPVGKNLIVGWQDGSAYGADVVNFSNAPAANGELQLFIDDGGVMWHDNINVAMKANFLALRTGEGVTPEINIDRTGFTSLLANTTVGDSFIVEPINNGRSNEIQLGVTLTQTGGTSPTLLALTLQQDPLDGEEML